MTNYRHENKKRLEKILEKRKSQKKNYHGQLYEECIANLEHNGNKCIIHNSGSLDILIGRNIAGRIDWAKIKTMVSFKNDENLISNISEQLDLSANVYILWDNSELPLITNQLKNILNKIDDVTAVSFDTLLVSLDYKFMIEFHHDGTVNLGINLDY